MRRGRRGTGPATAICPSMKSLAWNPEDARWLRGWLRSHLMCAMAIAAFLTMVRLQPHPSHEVEARASHHGGVDRLNADRVSGESTGSSTALGSGACPTFRKSAQFGPSEGMATHGSGLGKCRNLATDRPTIGRDRDAAGGSRAELDEVRHGEGTTGAPAGLRHAANRGHLRHRWRVATRTPLDKTEGVTTCAGRFVRRRPSASR